MASEIRWRERHDVEKRIDCLKYFKTTVGISRKSCEGRPRAVKLWCLSDNRSHNTGHSIPGVWGMVSRAQAAIFTRVLTSLNYSLQILVRPGQGQPGLRGDRGIIVNKWTDTSPGSPGADHHDQHRWHQTSDQRRPGTGGTLRPGPSPCH